MIYVTKRDDEFPPLDQPTFELFGSDNIVPLKDIEIAIEAEVAYKWRADCIEGAEKKRRKGDVWIFTMID